MLARLVAPWEENVMQIGFNLPTSGPLIEPDSLVRIVTEGEALGFAYVTISDHIMVPRNLQSKYPYTGTGEFPAGASAAEGAKTSLHGSTWLGWIRVLPSNPISSPCWQTARNPSTSRMSL